MNAENIMTKNKKIIKAFKFQFGATSLLITVMILFLSTVVIITVSRTTVMEQRMSANEMRAQQAFEAAQAGLDHALDYLVDSQGIDRNADGIADPVPFLDYVAPAIYQIAYCDPTDLKKISCPESEGSPPTCDYLDNEKNIDGAQEIVYLKAPLIASCGWSDDRTARKLIRQNAGGTPALGGSPTAPLITKGGINVTGSATISNYYTNLTIWSGGSWANISATSKTQVRQPSIPPPDLIAAPPKSSSSDYFGSTNKTITGPDVIIEDQKLKNLTPEDMFKAFLGAKDLSDYKKNIATTVITQKSDLNQLCNIKNSQAIVIDITELSDVDIPCNSNPIGTREQPVVIVMNNNFTGQNPTIYGALYVIKNVDVAGNPTVYGAAIVEGTVKGTGSLDITFDPWTLSNAQQFAGKPGLMPGTWRDW